MSQRTQVASLPLFAAAVSAGEWIDVMENDNHSLTIFSTPPIPIDCILADDSVRAAQAGDTLSMEPHGYWQARPSSVPPGAAETFTKHPTLPLYQFDYLVPQSVQYRLV